MAVCAYQQIIKYRITAYCTQPLHIGSATGSKEEVLIHPADDLPFIQAASIAGVCREYFAREYGEAAADSLFGSKESGSSRICFTDGIFTVRPVLELRPGVRIDRRTGSCAAGKIRGTQHQAGHKFQMEYIGAGAEFCFDIYLYDACMCRKAEHLLAAIHAGMVQFGGLKSSGCGFLKLRGALKKVFTMTREEDRRLWAAEHEMPADAYEDILSGPLPGAVQEQADHMCATGCAESRYEICVTGRTEGSMLVKSIAVTDYGENAPDCENIRNAAGEYIIPGSSLKGAVRNQMERIADYLGCQEIIQDTFGYAKDAHGAGKAGNIVFYDTVAGDKQENDQMELSYRIHIDKFTGGVMDGGLFQEKNVAGNVELRMSIKNRNDPDRTCGLLLLALRDLAAGLMNIGSGYSIGKGILVVSRIVIKDIRNRKEAEITIGDDGTGTAADGQGLIAQCLQAVHRKEEAV